MGKISILPICAIFCCSCLGLVYGQTVVLKSGQRVEGNIIEQSDKYVKLDFQGVALTFYNDEISTIEESPAQDAKAVTPQMEALYKGYIQAKNAAPPSKTEPTVLLPKSVLPEETKITPPPPQNQQDAAGAQNPNYEALVQKIREGAQQAAKDKESASF
jgi:hypothetical protein